MPITIVADGAIQNALKRAVPVMFAGFEGDATFVQLEVVDETHSTRSGFHGLDEALRLAPEGKPVLIMAIAPLSMVADDPRFQGAMGYPNVIFGDSLRLAEALPALIAIQSNPRPRNEVAIRLAHLKVTQSAIGTLQHDLKYAQKDEGRKATWMTMARTVFGELSFEEMAEKVETWTYDGAKPFDGERLNGCFVDIEGTLLQDGVVNQEIVNVLKEKAAVMAVNLWTDGDIKKLAPTIRRAGLYYNIIPKSLLSGATVEEAYDDLEQSEFYKRYAITVEHYVKV